MITYIIRRLFAAVVLLVIVSMITFAIFFVVPKLGGGTPESLATRYVGRAATAETVRLTAERLGFYDPIHVQYWHWIKGIFAGAYYSYGAGTEFCPAPCLGYSFRSNQPVLPDLLDRLPVTLSLAAGAAVLWLLAGISIGTLSALRKGSIWDRLSMGVALAGVSLPIFFTGLISLAFFSYQLGWFAPGGSYTPITENFGDWFYAMLLPWITLAFQFSAQYARQTRAGMLDTMNEDFIRTARAKGLVERKVVVKHGLRGALTPIVTIFGLDIGLLLGGAVLTESAFSLKGLGQYAIDAIKNYDLPKVMGVTILAALFIVIANLVVDLLYAVVDPRVRAA
ncbi:ABC transporter permease [Actinokineospora bangkokensis]|uniref:ABC transporter permease n=1 Tax=Actinokineospora bangkokensis TaxID=1193682 RepID=A0A1Q9LCD1_9PSEU|nr:ABC transporter permease [Actinokineospora bangkokensis]OLR89674.1 ABC transporter permease [Actinokineospora bangkokensis]